MVINNDNNIAGYKDIDVDSVIAKRKQHFTRCGSQQIQKHGMHSFTLYSKIFNELFHV